jgi:hypothetical protein
MFKKLYQISFVSGIIMTAIPYVSGADFNEADIASTRLWKDTGSAQRLEQMNRETNRSDTYYTHERDYFYASNASTEGSALIIRNLTPYTLTLQSFKMTSGCYNFYRTEGDPRSDYIYQNYLSSYETDSELNRTLTEIINRQDEFVDPTRNEDHRVLPKYILIGSQNAEIRPPASISPNTTIVLSVKHAASKGPGGDIVYCADTYQWEIAIAFSKSRTGNVIRVVNNLSPHAHRYINDQVVYREGYLDYLRLNCSEFRIQPLVIRQEITRPLRAIVPEVLKIILNTTVFDDTYLASFMRDTENSGQWISQIETTQPPEVFGPGVPIPQIEQRITLSRRAAVGRVLSTNWGLDQGHSSTFEVSHSYNAGWAPGQVGGLFGNVSLGFRHAFVDSVMNHLGGANQQNLTNAQDESEEIIIRTPCPMPGTWKVEVLRSTSSDVRVPFTVYGRFLAVKRTGDPLITEEIITNMITQRGFGNLNIEPFTAENGDVGLNFNMTGNLLVDLVYSVRHRIIPPQS